MIGFFIFLNSFYLGYSFMIGDLFSFFSGGVPNLKPNQHSFFGQSQKDYRGTIGNVISGALSAVGATTAAELLHTGYVNKDEDDYPFMPASGTHSSDWIACFPSFAKVKSPTGDVLMKYLNRGDEVAVGFNKHENKYIYERVLYFLHKKAVSKSVVWYNISFKPMREDTIRSLVISAKHLVFVVTTDGTLKAKAAERLQPMDIISVNGVLNSIFSVDSFTSDSFGLYAPVTVSGKLLVEGVTTSVYSTLPYIPSYFDDKIHKMATYLLFPVNLSFSCFQNIASTFSVFSRLLKLYSTLLPHAFISK